MMETFKNQSHAMSSKIVELFQSHIGEENAISRDDIFRSIRGVRYNKNDIKHVHGWVDIRNAFYRLRKNSLCFIQSDKPNAGRGQGMYFVPKRFSESSAYAKGLAIGTATRVDTIALSQDTVSNKDFRKEWFE